MSTPDNTNVARTTHLNMEIVSPRELGEIAQPKGYDQSECDSSAESWSGESESLLRLIADASTSVDSQHETTQQPANPIGSLWNLTDTEQEDEPAATTAATFVRDVTPMLSTESAACTISPPISKVAHGEDLTSQGMPASTFRFLDLPRELRDIIYYYAVDGNEIVYEPKLALSHPLAASSGAAQSAFGLVLVNRQVSGEFLAHAYRHVNFKFRTIRTATSEFRHWRVSDSVLSRIRSCTFLRDLNKESFRSAWVGRYLYIPTLTEPLKNLERLYVEVKLRRGMVFEEDVERAEREGHLSRLLTNVFPIPLEAYATATGEAGMWEI